MKLIIDIDEEKYEWVKKNNPNADINSFVGAIANGTPVSNEGDLISRSRLRKNMEFVCMSVMAGTDPYNAPLIEIDNAPTVSDRYNEGYAQGYIDGMTGADMRGEEE